MFRRIVLAALIAGGLGGVLAAVLQQIALVPLIERAETYEQPAPAGEAPGEPPAGFERVAYTVTADLLAGIGFALLLSGGMALAGLAGHPIDLRRGLLWGAAGFAAFALMPAIGLAPSLPGMEGAELAQRQAWWLGTAAATILGLGLVAFAGARTVRLLGIAVLILPHAIGAPQPAEYAGRVPAELAARFAVGSLAAAALFWLFLGGLTGWLCQPRGERRSGAGE